MTTPPVSVAAADPGAAVGASAASAPNAVLHAGVQRALIEYAAAGTLQVTGDPDRAERISARLRAGTVWVNCFFVRDLGAPFGGSGQSGIGREGGTHSFDFYCDIKNRVFAPSGWTVGERDKGMSHG